jgi:hypothetical protein
MKKSSCVLEDCSRLEQPSGSPFWKDYEQRQAIVFTFWKDEADADGLRHYDGPHQMANDQEAESRGDCIEMWALLCQKMNLLEHQHRVVSLLDAWSFAPYFVATSDDPEVNHWISLLEALQVKAPLKACRTCGDLFQLGSSQRALYCSQSCRQAYYRAQRQEASATPPLPFAPRKPIAALGQRIALSPHRH